MHSYNIKAGDSYHCAIKGDQVFE